MYNINQNAEGKALMFFMTAATQKKILVKGHQKGSFMHPFLVGLLSFASKQYEFGHVTFNFPLQTFIYESFEVNISSTPLTVI